MIKIMSKKDILMTSLVCLDYCKNKNIKGKRALEFHFADELIMKTNHPQSSFNCSKKIFM